MTMTGTWVGSTPPFGADADDACAAAGFIFRPSPPSVQRKRVVIKVALFLLFAQFPFFALFVFFFASAVLKNALRFGRRGGAFPEM